MQLSPSQKTRVCRQFEEFCKKVLRGERVDYLRELMRRTNREVAFSDLPEPCIEQFYTQDSYPSDQYLFEVCGHQISIQDERLGQALLDLGVEGYSILLLSILLDLSDRQIGTLLRRSKSTIQRQRTGFLATLKSKMKE